jgi:hypothetical protein
MTNASSQQQTLKERLTPPVHSDISALLNGMSNGAMVVGLPLLIYNVLKDDHTHPRAKKSGHGGRRGRLRYWGLVWLERGRVNP